MESEIASEVRWIIPRRRLQSIETRMARIVESNAAYSDYLRDIEVDLFISTAGLGSKIVYCPIIARHSRDRAAYTISDWHHESDGGWITAEGGDDCGHTCTDTRQMYWVKLPRINLIPRYCTDADSAILLKTRLGMRRTIIIEELEDDRRAQWRCRLVDKQGIFRSSGEALECAASVTLAIVRDLLANVDATRWYDVR